MGWGGVGLVFGWIGAGWGGVGFGLVLGWFWVGFGLVLGWVWVGFGFDLIGFDLDWIWI